MLLSDQDIRRAMNPVGHHPADYRLVIEGITDGSIGPASIDLMLSPHFHRVHGEVPAWNPAHIDPKCDNSGDGQAITVPEGDYYLLGPGEFCLASTVERFIFPPHLAGRLEGKSSLGRLGLLVHVSAGFFDPGFTGYPTLELVNMRQRPMRLWPGMPIAQMSIFQMVSAAVHPYRGKYTDQGAAPAPSQYHRNFVREDA